MTVPPRSVMNSRLVSQCMGSPPEPVGAVYRTPRLPRKHPHVLGVDLNRSESDGKSLSPFEGESPHSA